MSIEIGNGLTTLRTRPERCDLCRNGFAESKIVVGVYALSGGTIKEQNLLACGDCALLGWIELEMALERTVTQMKDAA